MRLQHGRLGELRHLLSACVVAAAVEEGHIGAHHAYIGRRNGKCALKVGAGQFWVLQLGAAAGVYTRECECMVMMDAGHTYCAN